MFPCEPCTPPLSPLPRYRLQTGSGGCVLSLPFPPPIVGNRKRSPISCVPPPPLCLTQEDCLALLFFFFPPVPFGSETDRIDYVPFFFLMMNYAFPHSQLVGIDCLFTFSLLTKTEKTIASPRFWSYSFSPFSRLRVRIMLESFSECTFLLSPFPLKGLWVEFEELSRFFSFSSRSAGQASFPSRHLLVAQIGAGVARVPPFALGFHERGAFMGLRCRLPFVDELLGRWNTVSPPLVDACEARFSISFFFRTPENKNDIVCSLPPLAGPFPVRPRRCFFFLSLLSVAKEGRRLCSPIERRHQGRSDEGLLFPPLIRGW